MSLENAHEGYEYQDILTAYYILLEILNERNSDFIIDRKIFKEDRFDDLTIRNNQGVCRKQIKYSNTDKDHTLGKNDLSTDNSYDLGIYSLFTSWINDPNKNEIHDLRLCLAWNEPTDKIVDVLSSPVHLKNSFQNYITKIYQIDANKLWPDNSEPLKSWQKFRDESNSINKNSFLEFCNKLVLEINFPKFSLDIYNPGDLELIVLEQLRQIGIGEYPNNHLKTEEVLLSLIHKIKFVRAKGGGLTTNEILRYLRIRTDYGSIEQVFPINHILNIELTQRLDIVLTRLRENKRLSLIGDPGSGKSWFLQNFENHLEDNGFKIVKHYCYTDLEDEFLTERVTTNVFYGNIISTILKNFPDLKKEKISKFASNLVELNNLLSKIKEKTVLIIDGLDHIQRVQEIYSNTLLLEDTKIIEKIKELTISENVFIILASQPITALDKLDGYTKEILPDWNIEDVKNLMLRYKIKDTLIKKDNLLSDSLLNKSSGNPLYLTYLIRELSKLTEIKLSSLESLPNYDFNLSKYYEYLLSKLNTKEEVPRILSGINFSLKKEEIQEITELGDFVNDSIEMLTPVLKINLLNNGYIIYHESFRRFIIEKIMKANVSLFKTVYKDLIEWLIKKGFYKFAKSYRFLLQLLFENKKYENIVKFIKEQNYLIESLYFGHSWDLIKKNYKYFLKASVLLKDFPEIIKLTEINKILSSTVHEYENSYSLYFQALGYLHGFGLAVNLLSFEGKRTLDYKQGFKACYQCEIHGVTAPWDLYAEYFKNSIAFEDFKYFVRYNIYTKNIIKLNQIIERIANENLTSYKYVFIDEILKIKDEELLTELKSNLSNFEQLIIIEESEKDIDFLLNEIINLENVYEEEIIKKVDDFFIEIDKKISAQNIKSLQEIIKKITGKNWFYNWIIFYIKVKILSKTESYSFENISEAFNYLIYDTEPFHGKPRISDLYKLGGTIFDSINQALKLIKTKEEWEFAINILYKVNRETTTTLLGSQTGPLMTSTLFRLMDENINLNNIELIVSYFENLIEKEKYDSYYSVIVEYYFYITKFYSVVGNKEKASEAFREGLTYLLSYTFRKDPTLEELIDSIESISLFNKDLGNDYIKSIKILAETVVNHTDGKGTKHFPVDWFCKFLNIDFKSALTYLSHSLKVARFDWRLEESLQHLLLHTNGNINPLLESFIFITFPKENAEVFLNYGLNLFNKINGIDKLVADRLLSLIYTRSRIDNTPKYTIEFLEKFNKTIEENKTLDKPDYKILLASSIAKNNLEESFPDNSKKKDIIVRKSLSQMTIQEVISYFDENPLTDNDLLALKYFFTLTDKLNEEIKQLIRLLVSKKRFLSDDKSLYSYLDLYFQENNELAVYYWICRYAYDMGGWYERFVNIEAFEKAYNFNKSQTIDFLSELLFEVLIEIDWKRTISANLINTFVKSNCEPNSIGQMWNNLYTILDSRLPGKEIFNWDEALENDLGLTEEEFLICILFSRLKINSSERHNWALSGIWYLIINNPEKMIKPLKWFFKNADSFLEVTLLVVLEIFKDYVSQNPSYIENFYNELKSLYPKNYFLIDFIIEKLLRLPSRKPLIKPDNLSFSIPGKNSDFYFYINFRHRVIEDMVGGMEDIFGQYYNSFGRKYGEYLKLYMDNSYKISVPNLYSPNYFLKLINEEFNNSFYELPFYSTEQIFNTINVNYQLLIAQYNSIVPRPLLLPKPNEYVEKLEKTSELTEIEGWIRIGSVEKEIYSKSIGEPIKYFKLYTGIIFDNSMKDIPFDYKTNYFQVFALKQERENKIVTSFLQLEDDFEFFKILWLNLNLFNELKLTKIDYISGLAAKNSDNEIVLKYNCWFSDYFSYDSFDNEVAKLNGAELLIRKDYFEKICKIYGKKPFYHFYKIGEN